MLSLFNLKKTKTNKNQLVNDLREITKMMSEEYNPIPNSNIMHYEISGNGENILNNISKELVGSILKLWKEKGFSDSLIENRAMWTTLLISEVSELADAEKKGLFVDNTLYEIADIVIRATDLLCYKEVLPIYKNLCSQMNEKCVITVPVFRTFSFYDSEIQNSKFLMLESMHKICIDIAEQTKRFAFAYETKDNVAVAREVILLWYKIMVLIGYCKAYLFSFYERENLQDIINHKMNLNFKRPYKYNTNEEMQN